MRNVTSKQLKTISNLLNFINHTKNDFGPHDHDWFQQVRHITSMYEHGQLQKLHSKDNETQSIFKFLINGMKYINRQIRIYNASNYYARHRPEAEWNRIQGESVCGGYWDNPLF